MPALVGAEGVKGSAQGEPQRSDGLLLVLETLLKTTALMREQKPRSAASSAASVANNPFAASSNTRL